MRILINTPSLKQLGGVANHYAGLRNFWNENIKYNTIGKRSNRSGSGKYWLPWDLLKFLFLLFAFHPDVVLLNPSLGRTALKRDFIFLNIAHLLRFKVAVFIHGFNWDYANALDKKYTAKQLNKASLIFVLAEKFKKEIISWGVTTEVCLSTTKVDDNLIKGYNPIENRDGKINNILFLARIERAKGIYIAIDTYKILKSKYPNLSMTIAGDGSKFMSMKNYIKEQGISGVNLLGRISGNDIINAYKKADLYILPSYGEGMPTTVLEAMAFGLPVFTTNVGGIPDFFENGKMGYMSETVDANTFAEAIVSYIDDAKLTKETGAYNYNYAKSHFMASIVAKNIENELSKIQ